MKLPREQKRAVAEALLSKADDWSFTACIRHGGHRAIAAQCGVTYEQSRTVQRNLLALGRASSEEVAA